jgi:adenylate cyclase
MEIERKFLMKDFPALPVLSEARMEQGYISTRPVVRIRASHRGEHSTYKLCFKSAGQLVRRETELPLTRQQYEELLQYLPMPPVRKLHRTYALENGLILECSLVDAGEPTAFYYAEVEFDTVEQAMAFVPPAFLGREVTHETGYTMGEYWEQKYQKLHKEEME